MYLFDIESQYYLPTEYMGAELKNGGLTKNSPRKWTAKEIEWAIMLKDRGFKNKDIAKYLYREIISVSIKMKRLGKADGKSYNEKHRADKYLQNDRFINEIQPKTVLDLYAGESSYYYGKVDSVTTNDANKAFKNDYSEKAEKLLCKLYYEGKKYDLIDIDPFGSGFDCFDLSIKMAKKGIIITMGELGHKRWGRLDFVRRHYGIKELEDFTADAIVEQIVQIGERNKKNLIPIIVKEYRNISRAYFKIEPIKIVEQWQ